MIDRSIARVGYFILALFFLLALRQTQLATIQAAALRENSYNPRSHLTVRDRGPILARDGAVLAQSLGSRRIYPTGTSLAQTVGYVSSRYGTSGLEQVFDDVLKPRPATENPVNRIRELFDPKAPTRGNAGGRVVTTIDSATQAAFEAGLSSYPRGAGVALDPRTGEVLAMVSKPSFDASTIDADFAALARNPDSALLNRATNGLYPPGSTFKIVTAAGALTQNVTSLDAVFSDPGYLQIDGAVIHDNDGEATGRRTLTDAFALSSNVDFAQIGLELGVPRFFTTLQSFGIGEPIGFTIDTSKDRIPNPADVSDSILGQLAFGQANLLVSPLRMALVAASVASGGAMPRPTLVREIVTADGRRTTVAPAELAHPMSASVAASLNGMMKAVVLRGTGTAASLPGIYVAGKTGTATNPAGAPHAWFVAFAPADYPKIAVAVIVENAGYGGTVAAPIARRVIASYLAEHP